MIVWETGTHADESVRLRAKDMAERIAGELDGEAGISLVYLAEKAESLLGALRALGVDVR